MQKECGQQTQPSRNDCDCKLIWRNWRLVVVNLRVQSEERPAIEKEQREAQEKENALKVALSAIAENHHHPEELQQRPRRVAKESNIEQRIHWTPTCRILRPAHLQDNLQVQDFSCTT